MINRLLLEHSILLRIHFMSIHPISYAHDMGGGAGGSRPPKK